MSAGDAPRAPAADATRGPATDVPRGSATQAPIEYADSIRQRFKDKRIITDDNMGTEWF